MSDKSDTPDLHAQWIERFRAYKPQYVALLEDLIIGIDTAPPTGVVPGERCTLFDDVLNPVAEAVIANACRLGIRPPLRIFRHQGEYQRTVQLYCSSPYDLNYSTSFILSCANKKGDEWEDDKLQYFFPEFARATVLQWLRLWLNVIRRADRPGSITPIGNRRTSGATIFGASALAPAGANGKHQPPALSWFDDLRDTEKLIVTAIHEASSPLKTIEDIAAGIVIGGQPIEPDSHFREFVSALKSHGIIDKQKGRYVVLKMS